MTLNSDACSFAFHVGVAGHFEDRAKAKNLCKEADCRSDVSDVHERCYLDRVPGHCSNLEQAVADVRFCNLLGVKSPD